MLDVGELVVGVQVLVQQSAALTELFQRNHLEEGDEKRTK